MIEIFKYRLYMPDISLIQDICEGRNAFCTSLCIDNTGSEMLNRLGNRVYELARCKTLSLPGFPDFEPLLSALKSGHTPDRQKSYRVSVQQQDRLIILETLAKKWMDHEATKDRATDMINDHNNEFNPDGVFWMEERSLNNTC